MNARTTTPGGGAPDDTGIPDFERDGQREHDDAPRSFGEKIDAYLKNVDERELGAAWWLGRHLVAVSFTRRVAQHREALEHLVGRRHVWVRAAEYSGVELRALRDEIEDALFEEPGGLLSMVALNEEDGRVSVGVRKLDDHARAYVSQRWPHPAIEVVEFVVRPF